jgi:hypothetical protein
MDRIFFFHLADHIVVNSLIAHRSCVGIMTHKNFREELAGLSDHNSQWDCSQKIQCCRHSAQQI